MTAMNFIPECLATKADLKELEIKLSHEIKALDIKIKELEITNSKDHELLKRDLKIWFGGMLTVAVSILATLITVTAYFH